MLETPPSHLGVCDTPETVSFTTAKISIGSLIDAEPLFTD